MFRSKKIPVAESTIVDTFMTRQTIVIAFVETALYARQVTVGTL